MQISWHETQAVLLNFNAINTYGENLGENFCYVAGVVSSGKEFFILKNGYRLKEETRCRESGKTMGQVCKENEINVEPKVL